MNHELVLVVIPYGSTAYWECKNCKRYSKPTLCIFDIITRFNASPCNLPQVQYGYEI